MMCLDSFKTLMIPERWLLGRMDHLQSLFPSFGIFSGPQSKCSHIAPFLSICIGRQPPNGRKKAT